MTKYMWLMLLVFICGCASPQVLMIHPKTGDIQPCQASGIGLIPAIWAEMSVKNCVEQYRAIGYVRADELTPEERERVMPQKAPLEIRLRTKQEN